MSSPQAAAVGPQFSDIFCHHPAQQTPFVIITIQGVHLYGPLYVVLSSVTLPLRQRIKPFITNKALSEPFYPVMGPFYPHRPPAERFGGGDLRRICQQNKMSTLLRSQ